MGDLAIYIMGKFQPQDDYNCKKHRHKIKMADEEVYQLSDIHLLEVLMEVDWCVPTHMCNYFEHHLL